MEQVIYADVLVFFNTVITFILLLATVQFLNTVPKPARLIIASLAGGAYSLMILAPDMNIFCIIAARIAMCISIVCIAFDPRNIKVFAKSVIVFICSNFLYFGIIYSVYYLISPGCLKINNGVAYYNISVTSMLIISSVIYSGIFLIKKFVFKKKTLDDIYTVDIFFNDRNITVNALLDTGNCLRDAFTQQPVLILDGESSFNLTDEIITADKMSENGKIKIRLLPVKSIAGEKLLPAFTVEKTLVHKDDNTFVTNKPTVAVTQELNGKDKYSALISRDFL